MWRLLALVLVLGLIGAAIAWMPAINDEEQLRSLTKIAAGGAEVPQHTAPASPTTNAGSKQIAPEAGVQAPPAIAGGTGQTLLAGQDFQPAASDGSQSNAGNQGGSALVLGLQEQLRRVGCYKGLLDGQWNAATRRAVARFNDRIKLRISTDMPPAQVLLLIRNFSERACGTPCPLGTAPDNDGSCMTKTVVAAAAPADAAPAPVGPTRQAAIPVADLPRPVPGPGTADLTPALRHDLTVAAADPLPPPSAVPVQANADARHRSGPVQVAALPQIAAGPSAPVSNPLGDHRHTTDRADSAPLAPPGPEHSSGPGLASATRPAPDIGAEPQVTASIDAPVVAVLNTVHPVAPVQPEQAVQDSPSSADTPVPATASAGTSPQAPVVAQARKRHTHRPAPADGVQVADNTAVPADALANPAPSQPKRRRNLAASVLGAAGYGGNTGGSSDGTLTIVLSKR